MENKQGLQGFKASETLLGIETYCCIVFLLPHDSFKASETLLGIETKVAKITNAASVTRCFKASETLLGIETTKNMATITETRQMLQSL